MTPRPRGPRPGSGDTRQDILEAARRLFAEHGYDRTTLRAIGVAAGVDPALIHHYFENKEGLFSASVSLPIDVSRRLPDVIAEDPAGAGEAVARLFFTVWDDEEARASLIGQLRHSFTTGEQPMIAGFITSAVLGKVAAVMEGDQRQLRAELVASHLLGVALLRYVVKLEPLASVDTETIVEMVAPRLQDYLA